MEIKILKDEKEDLLLEIDNVSLAELLRVQINKEDTATLVAWKREHPDKNAVFEIKTKGKLARKVLIDALAIIEKELEQYLDEFKKAIK